MFKVCINQYANLCVELLLYYNTSTTSFLQGDVTYPFLPITVFGMMCLVAGGITFLLPETINSKLPETFGDIKQSVSKCRQSTVLLPVDDGTKNNDCSVAAEGFTMPLRKRCDSEEAGKILLSENVL